MPRPVISEKINKAIRICIYTMVFCLPFSKAIVELTISIAIGLWIFKKIYLNYKYIKIENKSISQKSVAFFKNFKLAQANSNKPLLFYVLFCFFSIFVSSSFLISSRSFFTKTLEYFLLYFVVIETILEEREFKNVVTVALISVAIIGIDALFQYFFGFDFIRYRKLYASRITGTFQAPNDLAGYLVSFIPLAIMISFSNVINKVIKLLLKLEAILLMVVLFISWTRGAWLGLIISLLFLSLFKGRKVIYGILIALVIAMVISPSWIKERILSFFTLTDMSSIDRKIMWLTAVKMIEAKPLLGHGLGTFMLNYSNYMPKDYTEIVYAHNCYLQMAAEIGIIGLIIFMLVISSFFLSSIYKLKKTEDGIIKNIHLGILGGILAFLVHSFFDTNLYSLSLMSLFWFLFAITVRLQDIGKNSQLTLI